jgi:N-methylhydantoinase B/oxoprolinase/acetone carboxylase alpha subunit
VRRRPGYDGPVSIFVHPDRLRFPAPGIFGGSDSRRNLLLKNGADLTVNGALASGEIVLQDDADRFTSIVAGGAGYGPPEEREPSDAARDVAYGYVDPNV